MAVAVAVAKGRDRRLHAALQNMQAATAAAAHLTLAAATLAPVGVVVVQQPRLKVESGSVVMSRAMLQRKARLLLPFQPVHQRTWTLL